MPKSADILRDFVYSFHMPLFVWCSGYLAAVTDSTTRYGFVHYVAKRAQWLLIPYLAFSLIGLVPKILFAEVLNDPLSLDARSVLIAFLVPRENVWGHFWFLPMIFFIGVLGYGADRLALASGRRLLLLGVLTGTSAVLLFLPASTTWLGVNGLLGHAVGSETRGVGWAG